MNVYRVYSVSFDTAGFPKLAKTGMTIESSGPIEASIALGSIGMKMTNHVVILEKSGE